MTRNKCFKIFSKHFNVVCCGCYCFLFFTLALWCLNSWLFCNCCFVLSFCFSHHRGWLRPKLHVAQVFCCLPRAGNLKLRLTLWFFRLTMVLWQVDKAAVVAMNIFEFFNFFCCWFECFHSDRNSLPWRKCKFLKFHVSWWHDDISVTSYKMSKVSSK